MIQHHDLDVDSAHIANAIGVGKKMQSSGGMGDGFDDGTIRAQKSFEQILSVAGNPQAGNFSVSMASRICRNNAFASSIGFPLLSA